MPNAFSKPQRVECVLLSFEMFTPATACRSPDTRESHHLINPLRPRQNDRHFTGDTFKVIFFCENGCIFVPSSLKFVADGPVNNNKPILVQITTRHWIGDKPLSESGLKYMRALLDLDGLAYSSLRHLSSHYEKIIYSKKP